MKHFKNLLLIVALAVTPVAYVGCKTAPNERVQTVISLKVAGQLAESAVASSAILYRDGIIDADDARKVADFYDKKFQPAYRTAVTFARADLNSPATPEVAALAAELSNLVLQLSRK